MTDDDKDGWKLAAVAVVAYIGGKIIWDNLKKISSTTPNYRVVEKEDIDCIVKKAWRSLDVDDDSNEDIPIKVINQALSNIKVQSIKDVFHVKDNLKKGAVEGWLCSKCLFINEEIYHLANEFSQKVDFLSADKIERMVSYLYNNCIQSIDKIVNIIKIPLDLTSVTRYLKIQNSFIGGSVSAIKESLSVFACEKAVVTYFASIYVDKEVEETALHNMKEEYNTTIKNILVGKYL